jgi:hypothetical protein
MRTMKGPELRGQLQEYFEDRLSVFGWQPSRCNSIGAFLSESVNPPAPFPRKSNQGHNTGCNPSWAD